MKQVLRVARFAQHGDSTMVQHRFKVGQFVDFAAGKIGIPASSSKYTIVRLMPFQDGQPQYRIKSSAENFERVASENQLSRRL
jgi:hypothetical protein